MSDLIERVEKRRKELRLTKVKVAEILGAPAVQNYNNWCYRGSLPKGFFEVAQEFVDGPVAAPSSVEEELIALFRVLDSQDQASVLRFVQSVTEIRSELYKP